MIYSLSLHDALPIYPSYAVSYTTSDTSDFDGFLFRAFCKSALPFADFPLPAQRYRTFDSLINHGFLRSEEHTSELQSRGHLVCRLLLEKKKKNKTNVLTQEKKLQIHN